MPEQNYGSPRSYLSFEPYRHQLALIMGCPQIHSFHQYNSIGGRLSTDFTVFPSIIQLN